MKEFTFECKVTGTYYVTVVADSRSSAEFIADEIIMDKLEQNLIELGVEEFDYSVQGVHGVEE